MLCKLSTERLKFRGHHASGSVRRIRAGSVRAKRNMLAFLLSAAALLPSHAALAGPGMTNTFTITQVGSREVGTDFSGVQVSSSMGCTNPSTIRVLPSSANYDAIVASLLTAFSLSLPVHAWATQCDPSDGVTVVIAAWIDR
jgi:hypothetical protein